MSQGSSVKIFCSCASNVWCCSQASRDFFVSAVLFFERLASFCSVIIKKRWLRAPLCHGLTALVETHVVNNLSLQTQMVPPRNSCQGITEKMDFCFYLSRGPKKKKWAEFIGLGLMHPNRVWITTSPTEAEKDFHTNKTWISMPTYHFDICKLEEKKNPRRKAILSVAKLMNSTMHLSFTFGDVKFKKYINFKLSCRQYGHIGILLPHNSFGGQQYLWLKKKP